jgi:ADP-ribose pyrophosphatase YjhB (NUDIX family)
MFEHDHLVQWAIELQALSQAGLAYSTNVYDRERFNRIREIAAEIMSVKTGLSLAQVTDVFCSETGFQTPKLDTRAAIFQDGRILLVRERLGGTWSMPGGWVDVDQSIAGNTVKEVHEEAGLIVTADRLVALLDRNRHNTPPFAQGIIKAFVICTVQGGSFQANSETDASAYFDLDHLPELSVGKNTAAQIRLCAAAAADEHWQTVFD